MNIPFTKNQVENLKDPFTSSGDFPNRKTRRANLQKESPTNYGTLDRIQIIKLKDGSFKKIKHYNLAYKLGGGVSNKHF